MFAADRPQDAGPDQGVEDLPHVVGRDVGRGGQLGGTDRLLRATLGEVYDCAERILCGAGKYGSSS